MSKILVLFAHPTYEHSRVNQALIESISKKKGVIVHDLYEKYADFNIDVKYEQELLLKHPIVIWHHPLYWYSCPPLMKQWIDMVLEYNWAYGPNGNVLKGKKIMNAITTGGSREVYCTEGSNNYTINTFLKPFEQTATLCGMDYLPPFSVMGTNLITDEELIEATQQYNVAIDLLLQEQLSDNDLEQCEYLNDLPELKDIEL
ncbi:glutathione-regulated potassium-efflux system oxidoreductase KefF [Reichenbachiella versicolor]|uniref:glutathione-regulated potassium-efflux system oxidoreductase KefF n=1 Tax=Reichenbachiella versicolor TaxID=1821036 RepID=UPI000D6E4A91|nr:NAD(P)H-dependent oxidoreductase [Reichenbachiella versicolor]